MEDLKQSWVARAVCKLSELRCENTAARCSLEDDGQLKTLIAQHFLAEMWQDFLAAVRSNPCACDCTLTDVAEEAQSIIKSFAGVRVALVMRVASQEFNKKWPESALLQRSVMAISEHLACLDRSWESQKSVRISVEHLGDNYESRRHVQADVALLGFPSFIRDKLGEHNVLEHFLTASIGACRGMWNPAEEGCILFFLRANLRKQHNPLLERCAPLLRDKIGNQAVAECDFESFDSRPMQEAYHNTIVRAHIINESLQALRDDYHHLVRTVGSLVYVWARWDLRAEHRYQQNEVLLLLSHLIRKLTAKLRNMEATAAMPGAVTSNLAPILNYILMVLYAVEWPSSWKEPLIAHIRLLLTVAHVISTGLDTFIQTSLDERKETLLNHALTQAPQNLQELETRCEASEELFNHNRNLYSWFMANCEDVVADYLLASWCPILARRSHVFH